MAATNHGRPVAVIFDMDGVLLDSEPIGYEAMRLVMDRYGAPYDLAQNDEFVGRTSTESFRILRARHGMRPEAEELARQFQEAKIRIVRERAVPLPGVPEVLVGARAAGYRLALASSAETPVIDATVDGSASPASSSCACRAGKWGAASLPPTCFSRPRDASACPRPPAWSSRIRATGSWPPRPRACAAWWCPARRPAATTSRKRITASPRSRISCRCSCTLALY